MDEMVMAASSGPATGGLPFPQASPRARVTPPLQKAYTAKL